jgi:hypothetical protein
MQPAKFTPKSQAAKLGHRANRRQQGQRSQLKPFANINTGAGRKACPKIFPPTAEQSGLVAHKF